MVDKGKRDKGKREGQKKGKQTPKEKRKQKVEAPDVYCWAAAMSPFL